MKRFNLVAPVILLFLNAAAYAQRTDAPTARRKHSYKDDWTFDNRFELKLTPSSLLDPYGALIPIGLEYNAGNNCGISLDLGLPLFYVLNNGRYEPQKSISTDFKIRTDIRQYFHFRKHTRFFAGAEMYYRYETATIKNSYFHFLDNNCYAFDKAKIEKNNFGFGFITGMTQKLSDHFFIEYNIGIGVRIINTTPNWQMDTTKSFFKGTFVSLELPNEDRVGDHDVNIYIPFGIRVCYQF